MEASTGGPSGGKAGGGTASGTEVGNPFGGAAAAHRGPKVFALVILFGALVYCVVGAGLLELTHNAPFQTDANFALFAAFIVVAGAIERFIQPLTAVLPPFSQEGKDDKEKAAIAADRTLVAYGIALVVGIAISSLFGLYFLETMGVQIGEKVPAGGETFRWVFTSDGDKILRGLDVLLTALIITGGTKPLHDMITSIEKKKDTLKGEVPTGE